MGEAIKENKGLESDDEAREKLVKYFTYTAHYLVAAMTYMRSDQVSQQTIRVTGGLEVTVPLTLCRSL
jgi:hypothetical protein